MEFVSSVLGIGWWEQYYIQDMKEWLVLQSQNLIDPNAFSI